MAIRQTGFRTGDKTLANSRVVLSCTSGTPVRRMATRMRRTTRTRRTTTRGEKREKDEARTTTRIGMFDEDERRGWNDERETGTRRTEDGEDKEDKEGGE